MTIYEFNRVNYGNLPTMSDEALEKSILYIVSFLDEDKAKYYLLLNHDSNYYTLFTFPNDNYYPVGLARELIGIIKDLGPVKSIEKSNNGSALEIWIGDGDDCHVYMLFNYTQGVVEIT